MDNFIHLACIFSVNCKMLRLSAFNKSITYTYLLTYLLTYLGPPIINAGYAPMPHRLISLQRIIEAWAERFEIALDYLAGIKLCGKAVDAHSTVRRTGMIAAYVRIAQAALFLWPTLAKLAAWLLAWLVSVTDVLINPADKAILRKRSEKMTQVATLIAINTNIQHSLYYSWCYKAKV